MQLRDIRSRNQILHKTTKYLRLRPFQTRKYIRHIEVCAMHLLFGYVRYATDKSVLYGCPVPELFLKHHICIIIYYNIRKDICQYKNTIYASGNKMPREIRQDTPRGRYFSVYKRIPCIIKQIIRITIPQRKNMNRYFSPTKSR